MDTTYPAATFTATRYELLGPAPLLATAEIARGVCRDAERTVTVLALTVTRMRRIDGWLGAVGFVTHAAANDPGLVSLGSVCDRDRSAAFLGEIVGSLVGVVPAHPAAASFDMPALRGLSPASMPDGVDWTVVVTTASIHQAPTHLMIAVADGLMAGEVVALDRPVRLDPVGSARLDARLSELVGAPPRSVRDLLLDD